MNKTGRNDPCPCGSGKKYKKCHLAEDEASASTAATLNARKPRGMALGETPGHLDSEYHDKLSEYDRERKINAELDNFLHEVDFPDMLRLLSAFIPHAELEGADYAKGFFERVWIATETLENRDAYRDLLHRFGRENPELFAEIGGLLLWDILEQTVADGRQDSLESLFIGYAVVASRDLMLFMSIADAMAYFGFLDALVKGMRTGWPYVRDSKHISPAAKEMFARRGINYEVFSAVDASIRFDEAELGARIRNFEAWEDWEIEKCFELMSSNHLEALHKKDFSASPEERRLNPESQAAFLDKLNTLVHAFRGFLRFEKGVSWPQADLAAAEILDLLLREWEDPFSGELLPEEPNQVEVPADKQGMLIRNLCPDSEILDDYFVEKLYDLDMQEFRVCALWTNLAHWPEMLVRLCLVDQAVSRDIRAAWEPSLEAVESEFEALLFDNLPITPSAGRSTPPG